MKDVCIPCKVGSYLNPRGYYCQICGIGCVQFTSQNECTQCTEANNYLLNNSNTEDFSYRTFTCQACPVNCLRCSSKNTCSKCKEGLGFDKDEGCIPCKVGFYLGQV